MQPNEAYMTFNEGKDMLIMDNGVFTMINDGQESIAKGVTHKQFEVLLIVLRNLLSSDSDSTDIKEVADMEITKQGKLCALTITPIIPDAKAKRRMMFTSFVLTIDIQSSEFKGLRMNEKGKNYTQYDFSD